MIAPTSMSNNANRRNIPGDGVDSSFALLINDVSQAIGAFDFLFSNISHVSNPRTVSNSVPVGLVPSMKIDHHHLDDNQCEGVKILSGLLSELQRRCGNITMEMNPEMRPLSACESVNRPNSSISEQSFRHCNALLREALVYELSHSDALENRLKEREREIVEINMTVKKLENIVKRQGVPSGMIPSNFSVENDDGSLVEKFIQKKFSGQYYFGQIVSFSHPYYLVIILPLWIFYIFSFLCT
jgi:hypothetical protein